MLCIYFEPTSAATAFGLDYVKCDVLTGRLATCSSARLADWPASLGRFWPAALASVLPLRRRR
eukprot:7250600-Heterocapsa_arctica.AAC.1